MRKKCCAAWITSGLNYCCCTDSVTLISKDEVEGSMVSKSEANQVTWMTLHTFEMKVIFKTTHVTDWILLYPQFLVAEENKEEVAAPPAEDTGDVDDLVSVGVSAFKYLTVVSRSHVQTISCVFAGYVSVRLIMSLGCWDFGYKLSSLKLFSSSCAAGHDVRREAMGVSAVDVQRNEKNAIIHPMRPHKPSRPFVPMPMWRPPWDCVAGDMKLCKHCTEKAFNGTVYTCSVTENYTCVKHPPKLLRTLYMFCLQCLVSRSR